MVPCLSLALTHLPLQKNYFPLRNQEFSPEACSQLSFLFSFKKKKKARHKHFSYYFIWDQELLGFLPHWKNKIKWFGLSNLIPTLRSWVQPLSKKKNVRAEIHPISPNILCLCLQEDGLRWLTTPNGHNLLEKIKTASLRVKKLYHSAAGSRPSAQLFYSLPRPVV